MADGAKLVVGAMGPDQAREVKSSQKRGESKKRRTSEEEVNNSFHAFTPPKKANSRKDIGILSGGQQIDFIVSF